MVDREQTRLKAEPFGLFMSAAFATALGRNSDLSVVAPHR